MTSPSLPPAAKAAPTDATSDTSSGWRGGSGAMFDTIAARYDLLNRLTSLGQDRRWRRHLVEALGLGAAAKAASTAAEVRCLDVATGTGDVALAVAQRHAEALVTGLDPSPQMLRRAAQKAAQTAAASRFCWVEGDAQTLPFAADTFAASCISFGIRNVPDRARALTEMVRVTQVGGRVCVLELGQPRGFLVGCLGRLYVHGVVPYVGALLSGRAAYSYLAQSIAAFPSPPAFVAMLTAAGLKNISVTSLSFGAANLYVGTVAAGRDLGE